MINKLTRTGFTLLKLPNGINLPEALGETWVYAINNNLYYNEELNILVNLIHATRWKTLKISIDINSLIVIEPYYARLLFAKTFNTLIDNYAFKS